MQKGNKISSVTRQHIADKMQLENLWYHGKLNEPNFLARIFNLKGMKSKDSRYDNAYDDVHQHMVNNADWDNDWFYTDPRINLLHCDDETYLKFLSETLHPLVRTDDDELGKLIEIYNSHLENNGFEILQVGEISSKPIFKGSEKVLGQASLVSKKAEIRKYLNTSYVDGKINLMNAAVNKDTDLAIGTAKELLETCCKSILKQKEFSIDSNWTLSRLVKETSNALNFKPREADDLAKAELSIKQILSGISSIVQGVTELRNAYGTGHGKDADFKGLETKYAKLLVGVVAEIAIIFLSTNGESAELVADGTELF